MKRIVVLGAGFAGLQATIELDRAFRKRFDTEILLVGEENYFLFTPLLPQIASSYINPRHIIQPVRDIRGSRRFRFRRDTVEELDLANRQVELASGRIAYDYLVLALGSRTNYFGIPGAGEYTWDFKSLEDAIILRERILDLCEHADHTEDPGLKRQLLTFVIVGGGYTGVELATEVHDLLFHYIVRRYRGITADDIRVLVVEAAPQILRGIHPKLAAHAHKRLRVEGIEARTNTTATRVLPGSVELNGSEMVRSETIVWAAGVRAHALIESLPGSHDRAGRVVVNEHMQLGEHPEVFVVGDSAAAVSAPDAPQVAPVAIEQGRVAARNIACLEMAEPLESYRYVAEGMLVSLGMNHAVVEVAGIRFSGYFAWLFWNAVHLYKLVGFQKQLRVALDWSLSAVFPRDASIVRRPRRCRLCGTEPSE